MARLPEGGEPIKLATTAKAATAARSRALTAAHDAGSKPITTPRKRPAAPKLPHARPMPATTPLPCATASRLAADIRRIERQIVADVYVDGLGYRPASDERKAARAERAPPA